ncbi:hypothetical protein p2A254 (plasmid) [Aromatoleum aromaticum EbN1]|uniref:Uncharacterized protein n=1 Tax=Aromatoleum aromaticum (strain DSM 19018 / LMG 30748 / EbN1) TaxID=76114 RepID=Q5NWB3_AROAE|nr:hypothetical protein p2A254 [Aromatoleum aromaticum EbN1]
MHAFSTWSYWTSVMRTILGFLFDLYFKFPGSLNLPHLAVRRGPTATAARGWVLNLARSASPPGSERQAEGRAHASAAGPYRPGQGTRGQRLPASSRSAGEYALHTRGRQQTPCTPPTPDQASRSAPRATTPSPDDRACRPPVQCWPASRHTYW